MRGVADPGQVLHLVDEEEAVGAGPHPAVGDDLPEVERQHPQRDAANAASTASSKRSIAAPAGAGERPPTAGRLRAAAIASLRARIDATHNSRDALLQCTAARLRPV